MSDFPTAPSPGQSSADRPKKSLPPPPPPRPTDWSSPRPEIPKSSRHPANTALVILALVALVAVVVGVFVLTSGTDDETVTAPAPTTIPTAPSFDATTTPTSTSTTSTVPETTMFPETVPEPPMETAMWFTTYGDDIWGLINAKQAVGDGSNLTPELLVDGCTQMTGAVATARTHPPMPDPALNADWQETLDLYDRAAGMCQDAFVNDDENLRREALELLLTDEAFNRVIAVFDAQPAPDPEPNPPVEQPDSPPDEMGA